MTMLACWFEPVEVWIEKGEDVLQAHDAIDESLLKRALSGYPLCGKADDFGTLWSVVACPSKGRLDIAEGSPCETPYHPYVL